MELQNQTDSNGNIRRWYMTDEHIEQLTELSQKGLSLTAAAKEMGIDRKTLKRGAKKRGKEKWLMETFPPMRSRSNVKRRNPVEHIQRLHMQALTTTWR